MAPRNPLETTPPIGSAGDLVAVKHRWDTPATAPKDPTVWPDDARLLFGHLPKEKILERMKEQMRAGAIDFEFRLQKAKRSTSAYPIDPSIPVWSPRTGSWGEALMFAALFGCCGLIAIGAAVHGDCSAGSVIGLSIFATGFLAAAAAFPASMVLVTLAPIRKWLAARKGAIRNLTAEIAAFEKALPLLDELKGKTPRYDAVLRQTYDRFIDLSEQADRLVGEMEDLAFEHLDAARRKAQEENFDKLKTRLSALIPGEGTGRLTQDVTPWVAVLDAGERIKNDEAKRLNLSLCYLPPQLQPEIQAHLKDRDLETIEQLDREGVRELRAYLLRLALEREAAGTVVPVEPAVPSVLQPTMVLELDHRLDTAAGNTPTRLDPNRIVEDLDIGHPHGDMGRYRT